MAMGGGATPTIIYSILQMLFLSASCALALVFLRSSVRSKKAIVLSFVYFALNPVIALFSFIEAKDVIFGAFFLILIVLLIKCFSKECPKVKKQDVLFVSICALFCCLLRNNFVYALAVFIIVLLVTIWRAGKEKRNKSFGAIALSLLVSLVVSFAITGPLYQSLGIEKGSVREAESLIIQQLSKVVYDHRDDLTEQDLDRIEEFIPVDIIQESFNRRFADPVKNQFASDGKTGELLSLWFDLGLRYPKEYAYEFLDLNIPYWYPGADPCDPYSQRAFIETGIYDRTNYYSFERDSKIPSLFSFYEGFVFIYSLQSKPIISAFVSLSMPLWVMLLCLCFVMYKRKHHVAIALLLPLLLWATYLLGPVSNFRYIFPLFLSLPVIVSCSFCWNQNSVTQSKGNDVVTL